VAKSAPAFFSYSREDSDFALKLAGDLKAAGASVWMDQLDITPGDRWDRAVQDALVGCTCTLVVLSPAAVESTNVMDEVSFALDEGKFLIPIIYRDCRVPFRLHRVQHLDFRQQYDHGLQSLIQVLALGTVSGQNGTAIKGAESQERSHVSDAGAPQRTTEQAQLEDEREKAVEQAKRLALEELKRQQRSIQVEQLRVQAQAAFADRQFDEALKCVNQAFGLDPNNADLSRLLQSIEEEADRERGIVATLRSGQEAFCAGDLSVATDAVNKVLEIRADHAEARALEALIQKEIEDQTRKAKLKELLEEARREISGRNFTSALRVLSDAQTIDPSDSNTLGLIAWVSRRHEQEELKHELHEATNEIGHLLEQANYAEALRVCEVALQRFPNEPALVELKQLAQHQFELFERRRAVEDLCSEARRLTDAGQPEESLDLLEKAVSSFPGEPRVETLLTMSRVDCERKRQEQEERESQSQNPHDEQPPVETSAITKKELAALLRSFQEGLAGRLSISQLHSLADRVAALAKQSALSDEETAQFAEATATFENRYTRWRRDCEDLESICQSLDEAQGSTVVQDLLDRARSILERNGKDEEIRDKYKRVRAFAGRFNSQRDSAVTEVSGLVQSMQATQNLEELSEMEKQIGGLSPFWRDDPLIRGLLDQAAVYLEEVRNQKQSLLEELAQISKTIPAARSTGEITLQLEQAQMLASEQPDDADVTSAFRTVADLAQDLRRQLEALVSETQALTRNIIASTRIDEIEASSQKAHQVPEQFLSFEEISDLLRKLGRLAEERRKHYERVQRSLASLMASAESAHGPAELDSIRVRSREVLKGWQADSGLGQTIEKLDSVLEARKSELAALASAAEAKEEVTSDGLEDIPNPELGVQQRHRVALKLRPLFVALGLIAVASVIAVVSIRLVPGTVQLNAPAGASIFIDGKTCASPCRAKLAPGQHNALVQLAGYQDLQEAFAVSSFETKIVTLNMTKLTGQGKSDEARPRADTKASPNGMSTPANQPKDTGNTKVVANTTGVNGAVRTSTNPQSAASGQQAPNPASSAPNAIPTGAPAVHVVTPPPAVPTISFSSPMQTIQRGQEAELDWRTQNATDVRIDGSSVNADGSMQVTPQQSTTYTLTAQGPGGEVTQSLHLDVESPPAPPVNPELASVKAALNLYRQAYESESIDDMQHVWPQMSKAEKKNMMDTFDLFNAIHLSLNCPDQSIKIQGDSATASCQETATNTVKGKKRPALSSKATFTLKKLGGSWSILEVQ
jgi:tetratricopeptide (TPR) repeat protein